MSIFIAPKNSGLERCRELAENLLPKKIRLIRGEDIPLFLNGIISRGKKAIGITGEDLFREFLLNYSQCNIKVLERILWDDKTARFRKPALCLLGPDRKNIDKISETARVCINRKYSALAETFLSQYNKGITFEKMYLSGATEEAFEDDLCDLVIDIVYSGKSAEEAGLEVYEKISESDIVILGGKNGN